MATRDGKDPKVERREAEDPADDAPPAGSDDKGDGSSASDDGLPSREELAGALGVTADSPEIDRQLADLRSQQVVKDIVRQQQEAAARERAAAEAAARQRAEAEAAKNRYTVEYDDPFTGERVKEVHEKSPEWSSPLAAADAKTMLDAQELIRKGVTRERLETEGYSETTTGKIGDDTFTVTHTARPDGRIETVTSVVDEDGDGTRTVTVRESLSGSGISMVEEALDGGKVVGREVLRQTPGADGKVPTAGPNAPPSVAPPDISQADADAFVDALSAGGPTTAGGKALLDQIDKDLGIDSAPPTAAPPGPGVGSSSTTTDTRGHGSGSTGSTGGSSSSGSTAGSRDMGDGFGGPHADPGGGTRGGDTGSGTGPSSAGAAPSAGGGDAGSANGDAPPWAAALDGLGSGSSSDGGDYVGNSGSRGSDVGTSNLGIGSLGTVNNGIPAGDTGTGGGRSATVSVNPDDMTVEPDIVVDVTTVTRPDGTVDHTVVTYSDGSKDTLSADGKVVFHTNPPVSDTSNDGTNPNSGTTDDDGGGGGDDTSGDDASDGSDDAGDDGADDSDGTHDGDGSADDDSGDTATALRDPDAVAWSVSADDVERIVTVRASDGVHGGDTVNPADGDLPEITGPPSRPEDPGSETPNPDADDGSSTFVRVPEVLPGDEISRPVGPDGPIVPEFDPSHLNDPSPYEHDAAMTGTEMGAAFPMGGLGGGAMVHEPGFSSPGAIEVGADFGAGNLDAGHLDIGHGMLDPGGADMLEGPTHDSDLDGFDDGHPH